MQIQAIHPNFIMPTKGSDEAGAFDIYMPEGDYIYNTPKIINLGFAAAVPKGYAALLLPRSGVGFKYGVELNNTIGLIDSDFVGEWKASLKTKSETEFSWKQGDRVLQFMIVPIAQVTLELVKYLGDTERGTGGFGSSGK